jgi:hypothetical protein
MTRDVLQRPLDAGGNPIKNIGEPTQPGDATFTDNVLPPSPVGATASPGGSRLAAAADHVHADPAPMRIAASGRTTVAGAARVTLVTFIRAPGELFPPGGYVFASDDVDGLTWENVVSGADHIATCHERTGRPDELAFRAFNNDGAARTIDWATVALTVMPAGGGP